ncbi:MAG TPA: hypothetical protein VL651_07360 [Bacteroidia bacterium]|nr:hypothetical protein [Bacteroidia bacterium]
MKPLTLFLLLASTPLFSQTDSCNRLNAKGQKIGYWKRFLDENANPTDSANACFYGYEFYDEGKLTYDIFNKDRNGVPYKIVYSDSIPPKGKPVALNGTFRFYRLFEGNEQLAFEEYYTDGYATIFNEYLFGPLSMTVDFTDKYQNTPGTFHTTDFVTYNVTTDTRHKTTCYWYRKVKKKWKAVETTCN